MGNCQKKDQQQTVTNFDDDKWSMVPTNISSYCFILKNNYHPNVKLLKWISTYNKQNKIAKWRAQKKYQFLVNIYESGTTRTTNAHKQSINTKANATNLNDIDERIEKKPYFITEQLIRLKDLKFTEQQAAVIAFKALKGYQILIKQLGGFVARQNMIFVNRQGTVKIWINEDLASNQFQFPYPSIKQQQFIKSLLHQIFTRSVSQPSYDYDQSVRIYDYLVSGEISFYEVLSKLDYYIRQNNISTSISIQKYMFQRVIESYELRGLNKDGQLAKKSARSKSHNAVYQSQQSSLNNLKFIVAGGDSKSQKSQNYVRDYSQKYIPQPLFFGPNRSASNDPLNNRVITQPYPQSASYVLVQPNQYVNMNVQYAIPYPYAVIINQPYII